MLFQNFVKFASPVFIEVCVAFALYSVCVQLEFNSPGINTTIVLVISSRAYTPHLLQFHLEGNIMHMWLCYFGLFVLNLSDSTGAARIGTEVEVALMEVVISIWE